MESPMPSLDEDGQRDPENFSLVLGGPLFELLRRAHLSDDVLLLVRRRILFISLVAWLPLLLLSAFEGHLMPGSATVPFLLDADVNIRLLVALPLLIGAERVVYRRMRPVVRVFRERKIIPDSAMAQFNATVAAAFRLRNSAMVEVLLIVFVYVVGILIIWRQHIALDTGTWYTTPSAKGNRLSSAGMWYGYVSLPIFQFLLCRWYFRLFIWARFLWQVSCIELSLIPTHPDRNAGLGFLSGAVYAFNLIAAAHGAILSGVLANRILLLGAALADFAWEIVALVIFLLCVFLGPLLVFAPQLARAKRTGNREYDTLAERYVREFDEKWLRGGASASEPLVGSGDIQSLADLGNSLEVVRTMRIAPVRRGGIIGLVAATLMPIAPLVLTIVPIDQLVKLLLGMLF
ncbi:MAG: hypothetical protein P4L90_27400 [Rhodopila sp.]|nr:hypothetical protein [Rhodopila sp.]